MCRRSGSSRATSSCPSGLPVAGDGARLRRGHGRYSRQSGALAVLAGSPARTGPGVPAKPAALVEGCPVQHEQTSTARTAPEAPARVPPKVPIPPAVLLSPDSPLHARPAALHRRQALALDGISDSIDMTIIAYRQLRVALWTDMQMIDQPASRPVYLQTIMSAWTIV